MPMEFGAASLVLSVVVDSLLELSLLGLLELSEYDDELSYELLDSEEELSVVADESVAAALLSSAGAAPVSSATEIGRAHVTPVTNANLVCRLLLDKKKH